MVIVLPPSGAPSRRLPAWVGQVMRFGIVGGLAAALDFGVLSLIIGAGGSRYAARIVSVAMSMVFTWFLNRRLTFATATPPSWAEFGRYTAVAIAGIALNLAIYWSALWFGAATWLAFVVGTGITAVFSFFRYRAVLG